MMFDLQSCYIDGAQIAFDSVLRKALIDKFILELCAVNEWVTSFDLTFFCMEHCVIVIGMFEVYWVQGSWFDMMSSETVKVYS